MKNFQTTLKEISLGTYDEKKKSVEKKRFEGITEILDLKVYEIY